MTEKWCNNNMRYKIKEKYKSNTGPLDGVAVEILFELN